jgi:hypothetical protein
MATITTIKQLRATPVGTIFKDKDGYTIVKTDVNDYFVISPKLDGDNMWACAEEINGDFSGEQAFFPMTIKEV